MPPLVPNVPWVSHLNAVVDIEVVRVCGGLVGGGRVDHAEVDAAHPGVELINDIHVLDERPVLHEATPREVAGLGDGGVVRYGRLLCGQILAVVRDGRR